MHDDKLGIRTAGAWLLVVIGLGSSCAEPARAPNPEPAGAPHAAPASVDDALRARVADASRPGAHRARDKYRHPLETLRFCEVQPGERLVEIWPGGQGGYYRSILEPFIRDGGGTYVPISQREDPFPAAVAAAPDGAADRVLVFRAHGFMDQTLPGQDHVDALFRMLKPGGVLCVVDHAGDERVEQDPKAVNGYVNESHFIRLALRAGFRIRAASDVNRNPRDKKDHPHGVYSLPPTLRGTDEGSPERARFVAIGESDRFTHLYVKPAS